MVIDKSNHTLFKNNTTLHIETNTSLWFHSNKYFKYNLYYSTLYQIKLNQLLLHPRNNYLNFNVDLHNDEFILNKYIFLQKRSFTTFFFYNNIDIPQCFQKSSSLNRISREIFLVNFINYFMRHGLKLKLQTNLLKSLNLLIQNTNYSHKTSDILSWQSLYLLTTYVSQYKNQQNFFYIPINKTLNYSHYTTNTHKYISTQTYVLNLIYKNLITILPLFSFYIYKVDKKIFKNTRGKSGKYTFIWKYVAPYKRLNWVFFWLSKELKIKNSKNLINRFLLLFNDLIFNNKGMWVYKIKKFSYNYVYRNCRNTLAETYRTTTK